MSISLHFKKLLKMAATDKQVYFQSGVYVEEKKLCEHFFLLKIELENSLISQSQRCSSVVPKPVTRRKLFYEMDWEFRRQKNPRKLERPAESLNRNHSATRF